MGRGAWLPASVWPFLLGSLVRLQISVRLSRDWGHRRCPFPRSRSEAPRQAAAAPAQAEADALHAAVAVAERALLYALSFELNVEHAYKPVYDMLAHYRLKNGPPHHPATGHSMLPQTAWNLLEDRRASQGV